jgi:flavin reductase (DIM6/NTAB) family NADH-FMN oxidoreductase RutF
MTLNWATQLAFAPKLLGISVERDALTHELIQAGGVFSVSVLARTDRAVVRKFVKPVPDPGSNGGAPGSRPSALADQPVFQARTGAPILGAAVAWMDCELRQAVPLGSHTLFVGEVVDSGIADSTDDTPEVLRMEDTRMSYGG